MRKNPAERLGSSDLGFIEIRDHLFFADINWKDLVEKRLPAPWKPNLENDQDLKHIDPEFTDEAVPASLGKSIVSSYRNTSGQGEFIGFTYVQQSNIDKF